MQPWPRHLASTVILSLALSALPCTAAVVVTLTGEEIVGQLETQVLHVESAATKVEIPTSAVLQAKRNERGFEVLLADGSKLTGVVTDESLRVKVGLVYRTVPRDEVAVLMLTPPGFAAGSLTSNFLPADRYEGSATIEACPIRFELDAAPYLKAATETRRAVAKARYFTCDSLSVTSLGFSMDRRKKEARIEIDGVLSVRESFDKWARVTVEIKAGEQLLAKGQRAAIDAEERKNTPFRLDLKIPSDRLDASVESGQPLYVRVSVDVGRNGDVEYLQQWGVTMKGPKYENTPTPPPN